MKTLELKNLEIATVEAIKFMRSEDINNYRVSEIKERIFDCFIGVDFSYHNSPNFQELRKLVLTESCYSDLDNKTLARVFLKNSNFIQ